MTTLNPAKLSQARPPAVAAAKSPDTVSALDRGLSLLQCFTPVRRSLSAADLARISGIPRPTVIRLAATLAQHGWLQADAAGERFGLGAAAVSVARTFLSGLDVRAVARGPMQQLADATGGSVYLAVRDGLEMVLIEACKAQNTMLSARLDVGSRIPLPNSALGRAYLAHLASPERDGLVASLRLTRGSEWAALDAGLQSALAQHAQCGYCVSAGEFHAEINSVSVAAQDPQGQVMSFNCGGPAFQFSTQRLHSEVAPALQAMVATITAQIGGNLRAPSESAKP